MIKLAGSGGGVGSTESFETTVTFTQPPTGTSVPFLFDHNKGRHPYSVRILARPPENPELTLSDYPDWFLHSSEVCGATIVNVNLNQLRVNFFASILGATGEMICTVTLYFS